MYYINVFSALNSAGYIFIFRIMVKAFVVDTDKENSDVVLLNLATSIYRINIDCMLNLPFNIYKLYKYL